MLWCLSWKNYCLFKAWTLQLYYHSLPFQHGRKKCWSCSCVNSLISFGFRGASLERRLPELRRKGYSCQCMTQFWCCIKQKPRANIQVCVNVLPTSYRQVTNKRPTVGQLSADRRPTVIQLSADSWLTVGRQVFWGALLHNYPWLIYGSKTEVKKSSWRISIIIIVSYGNKHPLLHSTSYNVHSVIKLKCCKNYPLT